VVEKIQREKARCVLVVPKWTTEKWWQKLQPMVWCHYEFRVGTKMFELQGREVDGIPWPVRACLVDPVKAASKQAKEAEETMPLDRTISRCEMAGEWRCTPSFKRRERRKAQEERRPREEGKSKVQRQK
jgi:hypothetical protein